MASHESYESRGPNMFEYIKFSLAHPVPHPVLPAAATQFWLASTALASAV